MSPLYDFDPIVYIHKANAQELGFRSGQPHKAGRYFYISKKAVSFFPPLSEVVLNDHVFIDIAVPFADDIVLANYEFHNNKTAAEGTRGEYRLYLNAAMDPGKEFYRPDDLLVFLKVYIIDQMNAESKNFIYKILKYSPRDREYDQLLATLQNLDNQRASHALAELKDLTYLDGLRRIKFGKKIIPNEVVEAALNEPVIHSVSMEAETTQIMRSRSFRDLVLYFYEYRCAITGKTVVIDHESFINLEAAHICARASGGGSHPSNGMALERNLHWAFDKGFFTIKDDYTLEVHPDAMRIPYLKAMHGNKMETPADPRSKPSLESLKWHRENVYGIFLKGGE